eukprot:jgi/Mesvir1/24396/Mv11064-RA.1
MDGHALKLTISFLKCNSNQEGSSTKKMAKTYLAQGCDMESSLTITNKIVHDPKMGASGFPYMLANAASASASCAGTLPHAVAPLYTPRASDKLGYKSTLPLKKRPLPPMPTLVGANQQPGSRDAVEIIIDIGKAADQQAHSEPKALADGGATSKCGSSEDSAPQESKYVRPAPVHWRPYLSALQADPADVPANKKRPGLAFVLQHIGGAKPAASVTRLVESCNSTDDEEVAAAHTLVSINQGRRTIAPKEGVELHVDKRQRLDNNNIKASMFETAVLELMEARQMKKVASYMVDLAMHGKPY